MSGITELILGAIDGKIGGRPQLIDGAAEGDLRTDRVRLGNDQRAEPVEAHCEGGNSSGVPGPVPGRFEGVRFGVAIRILPCHELKGSHLLVGEAILEGVAVALVQLVRLRADANAAGLILSRFGTPDKNGEINIAFPMHYVLDRNGKVLVKVQGIKGIEAVRAELKKQFLVDAS